MKPSWTLLALLSLAAAPALAQPLIPPSRQYGTYTRDQTPTTYRTPPASLDKNFGLPTLGMPGAEEPQQRTMAPKPQQTDRPDPFKAPVTLATPETQPSATPDFFQGSSGSATSDTSDVPNFFQSTPDTARPRSRTSRAGDSGMETPLYSTTEGSTTGDTTSDRAGASDTPAD